MKNLNNTNLVAMYDMANQDNARVEYDVYVADTAEHLLLGNTIANELDKALVVVRLDSLELAGKLQVEIPETAVPEEEFAESISKYSELDRKKLWGYRRAAIRAALLSTLVHSGVNKKKIGYRLNESMKAIVDVVLSVGRNEVTESQIVHRLSSIVQVDEYVTKEGGRRPSSSWLNDELALQLVNELAEQDYIDLSIKEKVHMVSLSKRSEEELSIVDMKHYSRVAKFLNRKTILTSVPTIGKNMISRRSWWYNTPEMSADQLEFIEAMHSVRYGFVDDAEELVREAYMAHLKVDKLEEWQERELAEFVNQIQASNANGHHYVAGKFDSALRWYYQSSVGQVQTSSAMRKLVTYKDIVNPVKYDFRNNVVQMYSVLTGIRGLGNYVGLTSEDEQLGDLRTLIANRLNSELSIDTFNKDNVKPLFMIWAYNAGQRRLMEGVVNTETSFFGGAETLIEKTPVLYSLSGNHADVWEIWTKTLNELVPGVVAIKMMFRMLFKANPIDEVSWTLPDGSIAQYASVNTISETLHWVDSKYKMHTHTHYRKELVPGLKNTGGLPRIIHSFDAYVMRQLVIRAKRLGIVIVPNHDSFIYSEEHKSTVDSIVQDIFGELLQGNDLSNIVKELNHANVDLTLRTADSVVVTTDTFGDRLSIDDLSNSTPMAAEEM